MDVLEEVTVDGDGPEGRARAGSSAACLEKVASVGDAR
jgi:hypothetical protein